MNYLELINKCLLELNYKQVNAFSELVKLDHQKILNILNIINKEICNTDNWNFLLRHQTLTIPAGTTEIPNTIPGRIWYLLIDGTKYKYCSDIESFLTGRTKPKTYSVFSDKLLFPSFDEEKTADVVYYSNKCAADENGEEKDDMEDEADVSLIPMPFAEQLLVYGTCLRVKANPKHIKFTYWMSMYKEALLNLKSKTSVSASDAPQVKLFRS